MFIGLGSAMAVPTIEFAEVPAPIGQLDCTERLSDTLNLMVTTDLDAAQAEAYTLRLVMFTQDNEECLNDLQACPQIIVDEAGACGCIQELSASPSTLNWVGDLGSLNNALVTQLCSASTTLNFRGEVRYDTDLGDEESETISLQTDLDAPLALEPITVQAGENALVITLATSDRGDSDVSTHEVCVQRSTSTLSDAATAETDGTTPNIEDQRRGFSASSCKQTDNLKSGDYRYEGLENDVLYAVVVASLDAAGNRSENSAIFEATPASLLDFAEVYSHRLGGAEGESGGCSTTSAEGHSVLFGLLLLCFIGLRRERT
jgi:MYXO-CTERM domain-containing protein